MHEACSYDMKSAPVIDSLKRAHTRTQKSMSTLHLVEPSCGVKKEKKTLPQAVQSISTGPGLQTKHTLIIVGQGPTRTSEYMFTITAKNKCTVRTSAQFYAAAFRNGSSATQEPAS